MSKVDELRAKYPTIKKVTFDKLVQGDTTPTKKYLEYMLKIWNKKQSIRSLTSSTQLIDLVKQFDILLPYITTKDIYSSLYSDFHTLRNEVKMAEEIKEEKTFVRDENVLVIDENDDYLFLRPITHKGSLKYGAQTRWCTASKNDPNVYKRYSNDGLLTYLIDKKGNKTKNYVKVAFYLRYVQDGVLGDIDVFNMNDTEVNFTDLSMGNWSDDEILKISSLFRILFLKEKKLKKSKDYVRSFSDLLSALDFDALSEHMRLLDENKKIDYNTDIQEKIKKFINDLNNVKNATSTTTAN